MIVLVEVLRGFCCLSVVKDFNKFRKYNLQETARAQQTESRLAASSSKTDPLDNKPSTPTTNSTSTAVVHAASTEKEVTAATTAAETTSTVAVEEIASSV